MSILTFPADILLALTASMAASLSSRADDVAAFFVTIDKRVKVGVLSREARDAELCARAAKQAQALWPDDSLIVADLRVKESTPPTRKCCALRRCHTRT